MGRTRFGARGSAYTGVGARVGLRLAARGLASLVVTDALHHLLARGLGCACHDFAAGWLAQATPQGLAAHGDGLGAFARLGAKAFNDLHRNGLLGEAFNLGHEAFFVQAD